jgi:diacylglycerol kinase family enzyme
MKVAVILNAKAGSADDSKLPETLTTLFNARGADIKIFAVEGSLFRDTAKSLAESGYDVVVAAGGDGTVSAVASGLAHSKTPLGVLPVGTLNHFAKDIGVPLDLPLAVELIVTGTAHAIDIAEVNGNYFINNSSIGLYPKIVKERDKQQEQLQRSKWPAMMSAALMLFQKYPLIGVRLTKEVQDMVLTEVVRTPFVFIGNNRYEMDLLTLGTRKSIQSGKLSLYMVRNGNRWSLLKVFIHILRGRLSKKRKFQTEDFEYRLLDELTIETKRPIVDVATDGEAFHLKPPLKYRLHPSALQVVMQVKNEN